MFLLVLFCFFRCRKQIARCINNKLPTLLTDNNFVFRRTDFKIITEMFGEMGKNEYFCTQKQINTQRLWQQ